MLGWALSTVIIVCLVVVGVGALWVPRRWAALYGIVLGDRRALAFIRAMGVRDLVIGHGLGYTTFSHGDLETSGRETQRMHLFDSESDEALRPERGGSEGRRA